MNVTDFERAGQEPLPEIPEPNITLLGATGYDLAYITDGETNGDTSTNDPELPIEYASSPGLFEL